MKGILNCGTSGTGERVEKAGSASRTGREVGRVGRDKTCLNFFEGLGDKP